MKKFLIIVSLTALSFSSAFAQRYMTRTGKITFFSSTPVENIEAINNEASCVMDAANGALAFQVPIRSFKFEKSLMQEHFNENYMESDRFPKAEFRGKISDMGSVNLSKDGVYNVKVSGKLTIHGVTRDAATPATITVKGSEATGASKFNVRTADYGIKVPGVVAGKIAEQIEVTVNARMIKK